MADRVACLLLSNAVFALESSAPLLHRVCAWPVLFSPEKREVEFFQYRWLTIVREMEREKEHQVICITMY